MRTAGIPPSLASANLVIAAHSTGGKVAAAMAVLDELLELGLHPNSFTVAALLQVGGKATPERASSQQVQPGPCPTERA